MHDTPQPGKPARGSTTGRPLMAALDLLGRRWALRVIWELRDTPLGARDLRNRCDGMSSSVLYERLRELSAAGLIHRPHDDRYTLTAMGSSLTEAVVPLQMWAARWAASTSPEFPQTAESATPQACPLDVRPQSSTLK